MVENEISKAGDERREWALVIEPSIIYSGKTISDEVRQ
jgi:hypothetical protein